MRLSQDTPATLLVVDDIPALVNVVCHELNAAGYHVLTAYDGETAIRQAREAQPDLILLDVMMPHLDGFETCRCLKADPLTRDIPVILMTALSDPVDQVKGLHLGAADYVTKPIRSGLLQARIETHLANRRMRQQLQEQVAELETFASTVAHDLKTPLGVLLGYVGMALDDLGSEPPAAIRTYLEEIAKSGVKATQIINELLLLAQVLHRDQLPIEPVEMALVVLRAMESLTPMVVATGGQIRLPESWPQALGYAPWLEGVWSNYLSNGLKYGGRPPVLELGAAPAADGTICFWVQDNGPGLSPVEQASLFTEFTRLDTLRAHGHGLGLSIVRRIVERLGGRVGVESPGLPGQGCRFYFVLPGA